MGALLGRACRDKGGVSMRTLSKQRLQTLIDWCLLILDQYMDTGHWVFRPPRKSLAKMEKSVTKARQFARKKIRRADVLCSLIGCKVSTIHHMWIDYVLTADVWRFVLWLKECGHEHGYTDWQQQREEIELLLLAQIGKEIKRLGFQLEEL
jgi:hypothetical protein